MPLWAFPLVKNYAMLFDFPQSPEQNYFLTTFIRFAAIDFSQYRQIQQSIRIYNDAYKTKMQTSVN